MVSARPYQRELHYHLSTLDLTVCPMRGLISHLLFSASPPTLLPLLCVCITSLLPGGLVHSCNPSALEAKAGVSLQIQDQHDPHSEIKASWIYVVRPYFKKEKRKGKHTNKKGSLTRISCPPPGFIFSTPLLSMPPERLSMSLSLCFLPASVPEGINFL